MSRTINERVEITDAMLRHDCDLINRQVGECVVSDRGIERVIYAGDKSYTTKLIISKEIFIKAYQKWILEKEN